MSAEHKPQSRPVWPKVPRVITCLNCAGQGFTVYISGSGAKRPRKCLGCNGTGRQEVRDA